MAPDKKEEPTAAPSALPPIEGLDRSAASQPKGLTSADAAERLLRIGPNQIEREKAGR